jgi:excisionase family DNA binding protein
MPPDRAILTQDDAAPVKCRRTDVPSRGGTRFDGSGLGPEPLTMSACLGRFITVEDQPTRHELLTPGGVAALLFVDPKTVTRWAIAGKLPAIRTPGGHRRYRRSDVLAIMAERRPTRSPSPDTLG